jgi:hypothetical protein
MWRKRRKLTILVAGGSLLLCAAACAFWLRSEHRSDYVSVAPAWRHFACMTFPGGLKVSTWPDPVEPGGLKFASYEYGVRNAYGAWMDRPVVSWGKLGFDARPLKFSNQAKPARGAFELFVPFWFVVGVFLVAPLWMLWRVARVRQRTRRGRCVRCGYDLRGTIDHFPECGMIAPATPAGAA